MKHKEKSINMFDRKAIFIYYMYIHVGDYNALVCMAILEWSDACWTEKDVLHSKVRKFSMIGKKYANDASFFCV